MHKWGVAVISFVCLLASATPAFADTPAAVLETKPANKVASSGKQFPDLIFALSDEDKAKMDLPLELFADFWKKWHFVGARWRQDIHEFRLSYANDLAWKTLTEGRTDYPVGAMFGKLVYPAEEDLALPSSVMPANLLNRLMVMLWDPKHKKASSDGWVYLRFINPDPRAPQDPANTGIWGVMSEKEVKACVECHARAADRGYVFSQPLFLFNDRPSGEIKNVKDTAALTTTFSESMKEMSPRSIPRIANNLIESFPEWKGRKIMGYVGDFFVGALGEMRPVLNKMAQKDPNSIFMIYDRQDPNTLQLASSVKKKGFENCVGLVRLRGAGVLDIAEKYDAKKGKRGKGGDEAYPKAEDDEGYVKGAQGVRIRDLTKEYKPSAAVYLTCGAEGINRQNLPLLYTVKDKDGLPSYYFAPAIIDEKEK